MFVASVLCISFPQPTGAMQDAVMPNIFVLRCTPMYAYLYYVSKAVGGGPASPAMAGPLFWPKMVSAGPQFSIIRPKTCLPFQLFLKCGDPIN